MLEGLKRTIRTYIEQLCDEATHRNAVIQALERRGFALHPDAVCRAGVLSLEVYRSLRGHLPRPALKMAASVQLYMEAAFLLDDVADEDVGKTFDSTPAREIAIGITLLNCASLAAFEAVMMTGARVTHLQPFQDLIRDCITSCSGQYLDANLSSADVVSTETAMDMTERKAGGCGRMATGFAAGLAGADKQDVDQFSEFGYYLFTYLQLLDDIRDASSTDDGLPDDIAGGKKTVPIVYYLATLREHGNSQGDGTIDIASGRLPNFEEYQRTYDATGAKAFGALVAYEYLTQAKASLAILAERSVPVSALERIISDIKLTPQEILGSS